MIRISASLILLIFTGCMYGYQRADVTATLPDKTVVDIKCKQRQAAFALFGENNEMHSMEGVCGKFEGESAQVGFNEEGIEALGVITKTIICTQAPGPGCFKDDD